MSQSIQTHPVHIHDCDSCTYLGTIRSQDREGEVADLYTCGNEESQTVIARYSDEPQDYTSVPLFILLSQTNYPMKDIARALSLVKMRDLINKILYRKQ